MKSFESCKNIGDSLVILSDKIRKNLIGLNSIEQAKIAVSINMLLSREIKVIEDFLRLSITTQEGYDNDEEYIELAKQYEENRKSDHPIECPEINNTTDEDAETGNSNHIKIIWRLSAEFIRQMKAAGYSVNNNGDVLLNGEIVATKTNTYDKYIVIDNVGYRVADIVLGFNDVFADKNTKSIRFKNGNRLDTRFENVEYSANNGRSDSKYCVLPPDSIISLCEGIAKYKNCKDTLNYLRSVKKIRVSSNTFYRVRSKKMYKEISDKYFILKDDVDKGYIKEEDIISLIESDDEHATVENNVNTDEPVEELEESKEAEEKIDYKMENIIDKKLSMKMKLDIQETEYIVKRVSNIIQSLEISEIQKGIREYYKNTNIAVGMIKNVVDGKINNLKEVALYENVH